MAKRKHKKLTETQINNLLTKTVQAFHDGNLIVFYNSVTDLKRQLKVDTLKTAMHTLAMQITDEGTPTKSRFKAFEIIANLCRLQMKGLRQKAASKHLRLLLICSGGSTPENICVVLLGIYYQ
ncbi:MAG: hypothetical protein B6242_15195 [Anaerolineaceae bacterium 4572_78]|nr:MAG: hypothetical protein B6242_15195 [Anaerolineaceae bacterium 4572_78]